MDELAAILAPAAAPRASAPTVPLSSSPTTPLSSSASTPALAVAKTLALGPAASGRSSVRGVAAGIAIGVSIVAVGALAMMAASGSPEPSAAFEAPVEGEDALPALSADSTGGTDAQASESAERAPEPPPAGGQLPTDDRPDEASEQRADLEADPSERRAPPVGYLSVTARPWCRLTVDGRAVGTTPVVRIAVPADRARSTDDVLDRALGDRQGRATRRPDPAPTSGSPDLPEEPSRREVARVLGRLMPRIRQCAGNQVGMALATLIVRNDGTVSSAAVGFSPFGGTTQGACMERALRGAQFPRFRQRTFRVIYPFNIR